MVHLGLSIVPFPAIARMRAAVTRQLSVLLYLLPQTLVQGSDKVAGCGTARGKLWRTSLTACLDHQSKYSTDRTNIRTIKLATARRLALGGNVTSQPPLRRHVLDPADLQPNLLGVVSRAQRIAGGVPAHARQHQPAGQHPGIGGAELIVHQSPKFTGSHLFILARPPGDAPSAAGAGLKNARAPLSQRDPCMPGEHTPGAEVRRRWTLSPCSVHRRAPLKCHGHSGLRIHAEPCPGRPRLRRRPDGRSPHGA